MRLIDADHFLASLWKVVEERHDEAYGKIADAMRFMIEAEATFHKIDAVPVVRCKDCKYNRGDNYCLNEDTFFELCSDNSYCSFGKRRDDDTRA